MASCQFFCLVVHCCLVISPYSITHAVYSCALVCAVCVCVYTLVSAFMHSPSATETAAVPNGVSVLRLFRGLGLRGVQIPAARFLGEKGFLWYAPDQQ